MLLRRKMSPQSMVKNIYIFAALSVTKGVTDMFSSKKKLVALMLAAVILVSGLAGCAGGKKSAKDDIIVLFTSDVHCGVDENIGFASVAAYEKQLREKTEYVTLVDCGDEVQGDYIGAVSKGAYIIDIMNKVGYDYAVPGNHEFTYGMDGLSALLKQSGAEYLSCNIDYTGSGANPLADMKPYAIADYGGTKVAFIGVTTPSAKGSNARTTFEENGEDVFDFCGASGEKLYERVQKNVDECRANGADYVILMTHLGSGEAYSPFSSIDVARNTKGVDVVLDGHAHDVVPCHIDQNKEGANVIISEPGTKLEAFGQLTITTEGSISVSMINYFTQKDPEVENEIQTIKSRYEAELQKKIGDSEVSMSIKGEDGSYLVRCRETAIGNFIADAYRAIGDADIALINGGGVRADISSGDITYGDIIAVRPFGNMLCVVKATGQQIIDALEHGCQATESETVRNGEAIGAAGAFLQVSGLKFVIDTSVSPSEKRDENGGFVSVEGERRVKNVEVLGKDGQYQPIDSAKTYTVASDNYLVKNGGDGYSMFAGCEFVLDEERPDYQVSMDYLANNLGGKIGSAYSSPDGRIVVS